VHCTLLYYKGEAVESLTNITTMKKLRNKKGQYRKSHVGRVLFALGCLITLISGIYGESIRNVKVEAHEAIVATSTPDEIVEIIDVPDIDPVEVAMWFVSRDVKMMTAYRDNDYEAIEALIAESRAYVTALAIISYDNDTK
jgi:hypothetical protein